MIIRYFQNISSVVNLHFTESAQNTLPQQQWSLLIQYHSSPDIMEAMTAETDISQIDNGPDLHIAIGTHKSLTSNNIFLTEVSVFHHKRSLNH